MGRDYGLVKKWLLNSLWGVEFVIEKVWGIIARLEAGCL